MKITKQHLDRIIKEAQASLVNEAMPQFQKAARKAGAAYVGKRASSPTSKRVGGLDVIPGAFKGTASDRAKLKKDLTSQVKKIKASGKEDTLPSDVSMILSRSDGDQLAALQKHINPGVFKKLGKIFGLGEGKNMKITKTKLRQIIREAVDIVDRDTGEVLDFGEDSLTGIPDAAVPDLLQRLGLSLGPDDTLSHEEFEKLEDETVGKQIDRAGAKERHAAYAEEDRLNIDNLLTRLDDWAVTAATEYVADSGDPVEDVAHDLADVAEHSFEPDEWSELLWHFDDAKESLRSYTMDRMQVQPMGMREGADLENMPDAWKQILKGCLG